MIRHDKGSESIWNPSPLPDWVLHTDLLAAAQGPCGNSPPCPRPSSFSPWICPHLPGSACESWQVIWTCPVLLPSSARLRRICQGCGISAAPSETWGCWSQRCSRGSELSPSAGSPLPHAWDGSWQWPAPLRTSWGHHWCWLLCALLSGGLLGRTADL